MPTTGFDWGAAGSWAQAAAGFAGVAAVVWAANKGANTFGSWIKQKQTERQMDVADRLLTLIYKLERTFPEIRSPANYAYEIDEAINLLKNSFPNFERETPEKQKRLEQGQIVISRIGRHKAAWDELHAALPTAKAYFGDDMKAALEDFWKAVVRIRVAAQSYPNVHDAEQSSKLEGIFWDAWAEVAYGEDPIGNMIANAVTKVEATLVPVLRSHIGAHNGS